MDKPFVWKGKELKTMGDIMDAAIAITKPAEAKTFMKIYKERNSHAEENLGYMCGYYGKETSDRIRKLFKVSHPIFGNKTEVDPMVAFKAGQIAATKGVKAARNFAKKGLKK